MAHKHSVTDEGDPRKYWTQIPNLVFEIGLKPLELVLYAHLKRAAGASPSGKCFKSTATLAKETGMGAGTISRTKTALESKRSALGNRPLIRTREIPNPRGGKPFQEITITDIWKLNSDHFASSTVEVERPETPSTVEVETPDQVPVEVGSSSKPISTVEIKNNVEEEHLKKNQEEPSAHSRLMDFLKTQNGTINGGKEGKAAKAILRDYTPEQAEACYLHLAAQEWRETAVTWHTVLTEIGTFLKRRPSNGGPKILEDHGDSYTVMGADGTPSKRWRTPEAFARDTGRPLAEVLAKWN